MITFIVVGITIFVTICMFVRDIFRKIEQMITDEQIIEIID